MDFSDLKTTWKLTAHRQQGEAAWLAWPHPVQEAGKGSPELQEGPAWESRGIPEQDCSPRGPVGGAGSVPGLGNKVQVSYFYPRETAPS